jgi:hypothetical protein
MHRTFVVARVVVFRVLRLDRRGGSVHLRRYVFRRQLLGFDVHWGVSDVQGRLLLRLLDRRGIPHACFVRRV